MYTSPVYEGTLLEVLARVVARNVPAGLVASRIVLPGTCELSVLSEVDYPDWRDRRRSHEIGRAWAASQRSLALQVPSHVAQPWGRNVLLNPSHPDFGLLRVAEVVDVRWNPRLF